jgi:hypothetical protein
MLKLKSLVTATAFGAGLAYFLDPQLGAQRRHRALGRVRRAGGELSEMADTTSATIDSARSATAQVVGAVRPSSSPDDRTPDDLTPRDMTPGDVAADPGGPEGPHTLPADPAVLAQAAESEVRP